MRILRSFLAATVALLAAALYAGGCVPYIWPPPSTGPSSVNLVPNGGFEQGGCANTPIICGWQAEVGSISQESPHSGASSLFLSWSDDYYTGMGPVGASAQSVCVLVGPGAHPSSFWYGADLEDVSMAAAFYQGPDCSGASSADSLNASASGGGWQQMSGALVAPPGTESATFSVDVSGFCPSYQACWVGGSFDDLDVEDAAVTTPAINDFSPTGGPVGTIVDIRGANFTGATGVEFNRTEASFTVESDSEIQATVPGGATPGQITVTTLNGTTTSSSSFGVSVPSISSFSPTSGPAGTSVTVQGENLSDTTSVSFNGTPAWFYFASEYGTIITTVPAGASTGPISVTTPSGTGTSSSSFTVTTPP
jgi:hypothetical protein